MATQLEQRANICSKELRERLWFQLNLSATTLFLTKTAGRANNQMSSITAIKQNLCLKAMNQQRVAKSFITTAQTLQIMSRDKMAIDMIWDIGMTFQTQVEQQHFLQSISRLRQIIKQHKTMLLCQKMYPQLQIQQSICLAEQTTQ